MVFAVVKRTAQGNTARNKTQPKTLGRKKRHKTQNLADERKITGRFAKRFSGERPVSLGCELTFLSEFKRGVWRVLDRDAKRRACIVKHPPKSHLKFFKIYALANSIAVEKFRNLCYNICINNGR